MKRCRACGHPWDDKRSPGFREECDGCGVPLHACANCRFYDADASQWCREPQARDQRPRDPEASNTCDYFLLADSGDRDSGSARSEQAKNALADLFGDNPPTPSGEDVQDWQKTETPKRDLKDLFE